MPKYKLTTYVDGVVMDDRNNIEPLVLMSWIADDINEHSNDTNIISFTIKQIG